MVAIHKEMSRGQVNGGRGDVACGVGRVELG
jgi:hypothetical protein